MKRYIIIAGCVFIVVLFIIVSARLYPVAIVNGSPVWYRAWNRYFIGSGHALALQARSEGTQFNLDIALVSLIKKDTLTALIEDKILAQEARKLFSDFDGMSNIRINEAIDSSAGVKDAALFMYGFSVEDFHNFVLLPQSHREVIQDEFDKQKINVSAWFAGIKKKAHVRVMLDSYIWDGDMVIEVP